MRFMEGNRLSESSPPSVDISCEDELNRLNSDASTLTAENCQDILHRSANVKPEMNIKWTNEKHYLYLDHLEASFVKQLHQSIGFLPQCSYQNKRVNDAGVMHLIKVDNSPEKISSEPHGCQEEINYNRGDPLSHVSLDSCSPITSPWVYRSKRIRMQTPAASDYMPGHLMLFDTENHVKVVTSCELDTYSQQCSARSDSHSTREEGTGQNFIDGDNQTKSCTGSRMKSLKTAIPDSS